MARNNYFKVSGRESSLFEQLVTEQIKIYGFDVHYIFRKFQNLDALFGEDPISRFQKSFQIEMFVGNYEFFESQNKIIDKFGINLQDSVTLLVSKKRFTEEASKFGTDVTPQEGDIIFFPEYGGLYEIKYVGSRNSYFAYELSCELFRYSGEEFDTQIKEVDAIDEDLMVRVDEFTIPDGVEFLEGERVYQGETIGDPSYAGVVLNFDELTNKMEVRSHVGTPQQAIPLRGLNSGASAEYSSIEVTNKEYIDIETDNTDLLELERRQKDIIDFSEKDPFSEGNY
jgi:hypothetical protein